MFDFGIGTSELLLIAMVLLIVVGPKELPGLLRTIGQWVRKMKALASEFQGHLESLAEESGVKQVKEKVEKDIGNLSIEDLDREFAAIEKEMREQLAEGARATGGPKEARDEDLLEEEERPLPKTLDLDARDTRSAKSKGAESKSVKADLNADARDGGRDAAAPRREAPDAGTGETVADATGDATTLSAGGKAAADVRQDTAQAADATDSARGREVSRSKVAAGE